VVDALGNSASFTYDQFQRTTKIRDALGNETTFSYDPENNLTVLSNALGHAYSYTYDPVNQTKTFIYPDVSNESYVYDANGNMTGLTNRSGEVITAEYDAGNRLTTKTWEGTTNVVFTLVYDDADRVTSITRAKGGVTEATVTNTWDAVNRITQQAQGTYAVGYGYDAAGIVTNVSYPSGMSVCYTYDPLNQISSIKDSTNATAAASYEYDAAGRLTKRKLENGTETLYALDAAGRVTNIALRVTATPTNVLWSAAYGYDAAGNRAWVRNKSGRGDVYQCDATYQVTGVKYDVDDPTIGYTSATNPSRTVTYNYDALGNRTSVVENGNSTSYSRNNLNQYSSVGGTNMTYDTGGNLTGDGVWMFGYDQEHHLVSASKSGMTVRYAYDGFGRRISKTVNGTTTRYIYSGDNLIEERDGQGAVTAHYIYEGDIDDPVKMLKGATSYYFQQDALGNVTVLADKSGQIVEQYTYDVFGNPTIKDGSGNVLSTASAPFLFTGREWDSETGLYHFRARAYSPGNGRFLQPDPIDLSGGDCNIYRYCYNSPTYYNDPYGNAANASNNANTYANQLAKLAKKGPNCMAYALGRGYWIQDSPPTTIPTLPAFGCRLITCGQACKTKEYQIQIYQNTVNASTWHVYKQNGCGAGGGGWSAKNGTGPVYNTTNPTANYNNTYGPFNKGQIKKTCYCCPCRK
jgi:RHS repeat-associated protein